MVDQGRYEFLKGLDCPLSKNQDQLQAPDLRDPKRNRVRRKR